MMPDKITADGGAEILIAEDSPTQAEQLKHLLEKAGYTVRATANGKQALEAAHDRRPALIISDIVMPEMNGFEFCRHIKKDEELKNIPVILLTALSDSCDIMRGLQCGADNFITKPYDEDYLLSRVQYALLNRGLRESERTEIGVEVFFSGEKYHITSDRLQILNLLLSTYEAAVQKNSELVKAQDELRTLNEYLEQIVEERTIALVTEIAERKRAEEQLRMASLYARGLIEANLDPLATINKEGKITDVNKAAEHVTGISRENLVGSAFSQYFTEPDQAVKCCKQVFSEGFVKDYPLLFSHTSGYMTDVLFNATVFRNEAGEVQGVLAAARDITERKQAEELRIENARLASVSKIKSEFLANMSHELRTPLNSILGFSELLRLNYDGELNEKQEEYVDYIHSSGKFLLSLINDILDLSKVEAGKIELVPEKISLSDIVNETLNLINEKAMKHNIIIKVELDPETDFIEADKMRVKQILFNLLSNAVKFSKEEGGTVTVTAKKAGPMAQISISDTGIGIKEEDMGKLFKEFQQLDSGISRKYEGTGLGLAISKKLVELHGGTITAESKYGEGSTFTFSLPIAAKITGVE